MIGLILCAIKGGIVLKRYWQNILPVILAGSIFCSCFFGLQIPTAVVTVELSASQIGSGQLFFDIGQGICEENSLRFSSRFGNGAQEYSFILPRKAVSLLRLDPMESEGYFVLHSLRYRDVFNDITWDSEFLAKNAIVSSGLILQRSSDGLQGWAKNSDPWLQLTNLEEKIWKPSFVERFLIATCLAFFFLATWFLGRFLKKYECILNKFEVARIWLLKCFDGRRMEGKSFWRGILVGAFGFLLLLGTVNIVIDPFYIWQGKILPFEYQVNERFAKIAYLDKQHERFSAYIMGSSRSASTDPRALEYYRPELHFYNFSVSGGSFYDHLLHLRYFLREGYPVKMLYVQMDHEMLSNFMFPSGNYLNRHHPKVSQKPILTYYGEYASIFPYEYLKGKIEVNAREKEWKIFDIENTGCIIETHWEELIAESQEKYVLDAKRFSAQRIPRVHKDSQLSSNLQALQELKQLCENNQIQLVLYLGPTNQRTWDGVVFADYAKLLREVAKVAPFWDFSGYNSVSKNDYMFYEKSHYRPIVAEWIASRIFGEERKDIPSDFGVWVNDKTVESRIHEQKVQFDAVDQWRWWLNGDSLSKSSM